MARSGIAGGGDARQVDHTHMLSARATPARAEAIPRPVVYRAFGTG